MKPKNKIKVKLSLNTTNYIPDTRYALVDTDITNDKKYIHTEAVTFFHSIFDLNHIIWVSNFLSLCLAASHKYLLVISQNRDGQANC